MKLRATSIARADGRRRIPGRARSAGLLLAVAAAGGLVATVVVANEPVADAEPQLASVSVAERLGITTEGPADVADRAGDSLEQLAASRSERAAEQAAAAQARAAAEQAELDRRATEEAARLAAEEAARAEAARVEAARAEAARAEAARAEAARAEAARVEAARAEAARAEAARVEAARAEAARVEAARAEAARAETQAAAPRARATSAAAPAGSYQGYAMQKLGGSGSEFSCLEKLWGKESGWNPNAQNPRSTAYGIPQFLDSTWGGTGIAKTSDGYRQIDAGLIYIGNRYGSPCGAWAAFQAKGWY